MSLLREFSKISTFIFDVDGVLTDGTVLVLPNGVQARKMSIRDGFGLQMAVQNGYRVLIVSGGFSPPVKERLEKLGIMDVHMSIGDKKSFIQTYMQENSLRQEEVLFMGDDLPDLAVMDVVGVSCCPSDAAPELRNTAKYISPLAGGQACARDVIEKVLKINGHWQVNTELRSR